MPPRTPNPDVSGYRTLDHRAHRRGGPDTLGQRLDQLFEARCDWLGARGRSGQVAVDCHYAVLTYQELDWRANQLARYLLSRGAGPGDRIGLLLDRGADSYIAMLAVLKIHAACVPLDTSFAADRIGYITGDAGVRILVSVTSLADQLPHPGSWGVEVVFLDAAAGEIRSCGPTRLDDLDHGGRVGELAYLAYPSGPSRRPKGVAVTHAKICAFVLMAAKMYGISAQDRVYEGLSVAVDFSVEGIWVAWMAGATLVPESAGPSLVGRELHHFLTTNHITALYCVPTLLATLGEELPGVRFVLVSGEACPSELLARWRRPGRRLLSVYGQSTANIPTSTPVNATADIVQVSGGQVTVHMTPDQYEQTPDNQLRRMLIE